MKTKSKKSKKNGESKKSSKKAKAEARAAKKAARKGDGTFPDILVVTESDRKLYQGNPPAPFTGYSGDDMSGLVKDGETVAVYKLRRVSTVSVSRKVAR